MWVVNLIATIEHIADNKRPVTNNKKPVAKVPSHDFKSMWDELLKSVKKESFGPIDTVVAEDSQSTTVGEALGRAYKASHGHTAGMTAGMLQYSVHDSDSGRYSGAGKTANASNPYYMHEGLKHQTHSPAVLNEIETLQAGQAEQMKGREKNEYGFHVIQQEADLSEKEKDYWFKMTHKVLKELVYATGGRAVWFVDGGR